MAAQDVDPDQKAYMNDRRREMRRLAEILSGTGIVRSIDPLDVAAKAISVGGVELDWKFEMKNLQFDLDPGAIRAQRNAKPADLATVTLTLTVKLEGRCIGVDLPNDPFARLSVECLETGHRRGVAAAHYSAWHLERDDPARSGADLAHPAYHFQYGGQQIPRLVEPGNHLLLGSPRVAHPPLDGVLAVDFVISNYLPRRWSELRRNNPGYKELVGDAQRRCWRPYAFASTARWSADDAGWDGSEVWPQVIPRDHSNAV